MSELTEKLGKLKSQAESQLKDSGVSRIDNNLLDGLVNNMKLIVDNKDAVSVSGSDPSELETVRKSFVVNKLGINDREKGMRAINKVATQMSGIKKKNRAAFYYLVQKELN